MRKNHDRIILVILLIIVAIFRIWTAINNIMPTASESNYLKAIEHMTNSVSLDTDYYNHPDNVILILGFIVINLYSLVFNKSLSTGSISQVIHGNINPAYFANHQNLYLCVGRVTIVFISLIFIVLIFYISEEIKKGSGIFSALMAALFPSYNVWSGLLLSDTCLATIIGGAIYTSIRYLKYRKEKDLYCTTALCALATMQKYTGLISCAIVMYCVVAIEIERNGKKGYLIFRIFKSGLKQFTVFAVGLIVFGPNVISHFGKVVQILITESRPFHPGADGLGYFGNLRFYILTFFTQTGIVTAVLCIIGLYYLLKIKRKSNYPVLFGLVFMLAISFLKLHWERWSLSIYITPIALSGIGFCCVKDFIIKDDSFSNLEKTIKPRSVIDKIFLWKTKHSKMISIIAVALYSLSMFCVLTDVWLDAIVKSLPDTRYVSKTEISEILPNLNHENSYYEFATPLSPTWYDSRYDDKETANEKDYIIVSSYNYDARFSSEEYSPTRYKDECDWYRELFENGKLLYSISPWIKYKLFRDTTEYGHLKFTIPFVECFDNVQHLYQYYKDHSEKYYGPEIRVYQINSKGVKYSADAPEGQK